MPPPPTIKSGDVLEVVFIQQLYAQAILNVLHFAANEDFVEAPMLTVFGAMETELTTAGTGLIPKMRAAQSRDLKWKQRTYQVISPTRRVKALYFDSNVGDLFNGAGTANVSAVFTKTTNLATDHTGAPGKGQVGSLHLGGIPYDKYADGEFTNAYFADLLQPIGDELEADWADATLAGLDLVLYHTGTEPKTVDKVTNVEPRKTVRVMRRRTLGVGI